MIQLRIEVAMSLPPFKTRPEMLEAFQGVSVFKNNDGNRGRRKLVSRPNSKRTLQYYQQNSVCLDLTRENVRSFCGTYGCHFWASVSFSRLCGIVASLLSS